ncbi:unnamed protein product [Owenia fusiformis]|uniref:Uncharacterized protein n=1 Tax=Owenia fusiformis TaxID=6347 RepID=A0A8J1XIZ4_OWEFU|nr:unnamed protein product [Owenia fusiformis]
MAGPGVFHVEFGINETQLTRALELHHYDEAEQMIEDCTNATYLDEGCYQRTPLYIVLCGMNEDETTPAPRNLNIAALLVRAGANSNYRVPATLFGSEYVGPGKTALELTVDFYNTITKHPCHTTFNSLERKLTIWNPLHYKVIGLNNRLLHTLEEVLDHLSDFIAIMLGHGGDVKIRDEYHMTPLHRTLVYSTDLRISELLCENSADNNAIDIRGNTPLLALCDAFPFGVSKFIDDRPYDDPYTECCNLTGKEHFASYMTSTEGLKLDVQNKQGRTALFNSMVRGDMATCRLLLERGASPIQRGSVRDGRKQRMISPLFAGLCSLRVVKKRMDRYCANIPQSYRFLAQMMDSGFFSKPEISRELFEYIDTDFPELSHLQGLGSKLLPAIFGNTSSSLRQQCARTIFQRCFIKCRKPHHLLFPPGTIGYFFTLEDFDLPEAYWRYLTELIDVPVLKNLVTILGLPKDLLSSFEIELLRQRLFSKFMQFQWFEWYDEEIDGAIGGVYSDYNSNSDSPSDGGDSDLEYW